MNFLKAYEKTLQSINSVAKITTFLIAVILLTKVIQHIYTYLFLNEPEQILKILDLILLSDGFLFLVGLIFLIRFFFLLSQKPKSVWYSQLFWLIGWLLIFSYKIYSDSYLKDLESIGFHIHQDFLGVPRILGLFLLVYLYFSPIKQFLVIIVSTIFKIKLHKIKWN